MGQRKELEVLSSFFHMDGGERYSSFLMYLLAAISKKMNFIFNYLGWWMIFLALELTVLLFG